MSQPTHEEIAIAAYYIYINDSIYGIDETGRAVANWYLAEKQLEQQYGSEDTPPAN
jgi:hypothetical protein